MMSLCFSKNQKNAEAVTIGMSILLKKCWINIKNT
jgi:hypothetical protein